MLDRGFGWSREEQQASGDERRRRKIKMRPKHCLRHSILIGAYSRSFKEHTRLVHKLAS